MKNATYATAQAMTDILRHYESRGNIRGMEGLFFRTLSLMKYDYMLNYPTIFSMLQSLSPGLTVTDWEILLMDLEDWEWQDLNNYFERNKYSWTPKRKIETVIEQLEIDPILDISAACRDLGLSKNWFYQYVRQNKAFAVRWSAIKEKRGCSPRVDRSWRSYQQRKKKEA